MWPGYYRQALELLFQAGMTGAMAWCYGDYHPSLWDRSPLKDNPHERHFGLFRHDGSPRPAVQAFGEFATGWPQAGGQKTDADADAWLQDEDRERYYDSPSDRAAQALRKIQSCRGLLGGCSQLPASGSSIKSTA